MKRHNKITVLIIILILGLTSLSFGDDVITIRLSYKVVLNPANGNRPPGVADADIDNAIAGMNILLQSYFRGYRVQRVGTITNVGALNDTTGPSIYYNTNFFGNNGSALKDQMEAAALANPTTYAWNANAINLYITNGICGGICSFPGESDNIIIIGGCSDDDEETQLHEIGHYFDLFHTQGDVCGCCDTTQTGECHTAPGDDHLADTLPDLACWNRDDIANWSYGTNYANLTAGQQNLVDDVFLNLMSYHGSGCGQGVNTPRMTELQLDRWTDNANDARIGVLNGRTRFVQVGGGSSASGSSTDPFGTARAALSVAGGGDIVLLRPGSYNETLTINQPITLRATRTGSAVIGSSSAPVAVIAQSQHTETIEQLLSKLQKTLAHAAGRTVPRLDFASADPKDSVLEEQ